MLFRIVTEWLAYYAEIAAYYLQFRVAYLIQDTVSQKYAIQIVFLKCAAIDMLFISMFENVLQTTLFPWFYSYKQEKQADNLSTCNDLEKTSSFFFNIVSYCDGIFDLTQQLGL